MLCRELERSRSARELGRGPGRFWFFLMTQPFDYSSFGIPPVYLLACAPAMEPSEPAPKKQELAPSPQDLQE